MKVLVTGGRIGPDVDSAAVYGRDTALEGVLAALRESGHDVVHGPVAVGEDVKDYDLAIVCPCNPSVWGTKHFLGLLWTMMNERHQGPPSNRKWRANAPSHIPSTRDAVCMITTALAPGSTTMSSVQVSPPQRPGPSVTT